MSTVKKIYFIFYIFLITLNAEVLINDDKFTILASSIKTHNNIVTAKGNILIYSDTYYITAQKLIYNKKDETMELFDDVNIIKNGSNMTYSSYAFLDFSVKSNNITPVLMMDNINKIWIHSKKSDTLKDITNFKSSTLSSCDCYDPAWSIGFSSGDYDKKEKWINTYNTTLYIKQIPIFYTPYFGFPTDNTRRTGLLRPTIGYSKDEGLLYAQPYFYAPKLNWDIEYTPQIRTHRGSGHSIKYRYIDSIYSSLEFETGIFKEKLDYLGRSNLLNDKHYGWDFEYKRNNFVASKDNQDGFIVSLQSLNDIDYINTQVQNNSTLTKKLVKSEVNYFYNTDALYGDVDFQYYRDTTKLTKEERDTTMQELPKIHLHKYISPILLDNLVYSVNVEYANKTRKIGLTAKQTDIFIPISYNFTFFYDYLNLSFSEYTTITKINYGNNDNNYENGTFIEQEQVVSLSTNLLKAYQDYIHTIDLSSVLTIPSIVKQDGDLYSITNDDSTLSAFPITKTKKNLSFSLHQTIYTKDTKAPLITHTLEQSIIYNDNGTYDLSDLENEIILYYKYGKLSNKTLYNHQAKIITNFSTSLSFNIDDFTSNFYYNSTKDIIQTQSSNTSYVYTSLPKSKSVTFDFGYKFNKHYSIAYKKELDLLSHVAKIKKYTFRIDKKCWALDLTLEDSLVASATTDNSAIRQNIFYIQLTLKPIVKINQQYVQKEREE